MSRIAQASKCKRIVVEMLVQPRCPFGNLSEHANTVRRILWVHTTNWPANQHGKRNTRQASLCTAQDLLLSPTNLAASLQTLRTSPLFVGTCGNSPTSTTLSRQFIEGFTPSKTWVIPRWSAIKSVPLCLFVQQAVEAGVPLAALANEASFMHMR